MRRVLDLDLLLYGDQRIDTLELSVPHPRMHERALLCWRRWPSWRPR